MTDTIGIILTVDDKGTIVVEKFSKGTVAAVKRMSERSTGYVKKLGQRFRKLGRTVAGIAKKMAMLTLKVAALGAAGVALAGAFVLKGVIGQFMAFEKELANVSTLGDYGKAAMEKFKKGILEIPSALGSATELTRGLYQVLSAGVKPAKALEFLKKSAKAAKAGLTDTFTAVDAGTTIINAFGMASDKAGKVYDLMFTTVKAGKTTFSELAGSVGKLAPIASAAGVAVEEMHAALATLTKGGFATSEAASRMATALGAIVKPSAEAEKMAEKLGLKFSAQALAAKGLHGFLKDVKAATGGNIEKMAQLFGGMESLSVMLALTGKQSKEFTSILGGMKESVGAVDEAFDKQKGTLWALWETFKNTIGKQAILIGEKLAPSIKTIIEKTEAWMVKNRALITQEIGEWIEKVVGFIQSLKPAYDEIIKKIGAWYKANEDVMKMKFVDYLKDASAAIIIVSREIGLALVPVKALGTVFNWVGKAIGWVMAQIEKLIKKLTKIPKKIALRFTGKGSTETMLTEKIAELQGRFGAFAGYVGGLQPKFTIDATMATAALEGLDSNFQDKLQKMIGYIAGAQVDLYNLNQRKPGSGYSTYKRLFDLQIESGQGQINDLMRRWGTERALTAQMFGMPAKTQTVGGPAVFGDINIYVPESAAPQTPQDWREIARKYILPELEAVGHA